MSHSQPLPDYTPDLARTLRSAAGLTQAQMAEAVGYEDRQVWSKVERGVVTPSRAAWTLALIVAGQHPRYQVRPAD